MPRIGYTRPIVRHYVREIPSGVYPIAGTAENIPNRRWVHYSPVQVPFTCTAEGILLAMAGSAGVGNFYTALYDSTAEAPVNRLAVSVSTAEVASQRVYGAFTAPVQIRPALYFAAMIMDNLNTNYLNNVGLNELCLGAGIRWYTENMGAYVAPPLVATPVVATVLTTTIAQWLQVASVP